MKFPIIDPTMAWPQPSPIGPHQTSYGTEPMTSKDNPFRGYNVPPPQPGHALPVNLDTVVYLADRCRELESHVARLLAQNAELNRSLDAANARISSMEVALHEAEERVKWHVRFSPMPATQTAQLVRERNEARDARDAAQSRIDELDAKLAEARGAAVKANREVDRLREENTELHGRLDALAQKSMKVADALLGNWP